MPTETLEELAIQQLKIYDRLLAGDIDIKLAHEASVTANSVNSIVRTLIVGGTLDDTKKPKSKLLQ